MRNVLVVLIVPTALLATVSTAPAQARPPSNAVLKARCDAKVAQACRTLGHRALERGETTTNGKTAIHYYIRGCNIGSGWSCHFASTAIRRYTSRGRVTPQVFRLTRKACNLKVGPGCNDLGTFFAKGTGVRKNIVHANLMYERACQMKDGLGCYNTGQPSFTGLLVLPVTERLGGKAAKLK